MPKSIESLNLGFSDAQNYIPVSYTHLDVYKRQKQGFVDAFSIEPDGHPVRLLVFLHG